MISTQKHDQPAPFKAMRRSTKPAPKAVLKLGADFASVPQRSHDAHQHRIASLVVGASRIAAPWAGHSRGKSSRKASVLPLATEPTIFDHALAGALVALGFVPAVSKGCWLRDLHEPLLAAVRSK